ncbi:MAG TPA: carbohydrate binding domain-containing protein [Egibacteraceae bacterium]|nr:carbohydrate binding domain-containing protein [Egibacteraceae bacterium]
MNLGSFAGFVRSFSNDAMDAWSSQDWSDTEGVSFWLHGQNTGTNLFFEVLENRNPGSTTDDAERWTYPFTDSFSGWRYFEIPFSHFVRKDIGNGAPNDGFTREQVHGWAFGGDTPTGGDVTWHLGQVSLFGVVDLPMRVGFTSTSYDVAEGAAATVVVRLNQTAETATVTVDYASVDLQGAAIPDDDYTPVSGTLTFPPGNREQAFQVATFGNGKYTGDRRVILQLSNPVNADLDFVGQAAVTIEDAERFDPGLVDDFESFPHLWDASGNVDLDSVKVTPGDPLERPGQAPREGVLIAERSDSASAALRRDFPLGRDWSLPEGLTFWHYGEGTGDEITVTLKDNRGADPGPAGWDLVWSDEFDGPAGSPPDPDHWTHEIGDGLVNGLSGWGNSERQYYTDSTDNAAHDGAGNLVITAEEADGSLQCYYGPCEYTSARLLSQNKLEFAHGRIAASIKVPEGDGWWPAFWALGADIGEVGWPQSGEIDIMEFVGRQPQTVHGTIHGPGYSGGQGVGGHIDVGEPVGDAFREFAVEWTPDRISWLLDGVEYFSADPGDVSGEWVFNAPFFLLLNLAVGGTFPGPVGEDTVFPQEMVVEYVRVYQGPDSAEQFDASFTDDATGWRQVSIPFSEFARSGDQPAGAPDDGLGLNEVWGYGFALPAGGDLDTLIIDHVELAAPSEAVVTTAANSGPGSLRSAIAGVSAGGVITFDPALAGETITLASGALTIGKDLTIDASGAPGLRISGNNTSRVFVVDSGVSAEISHVEVVDGLGAVQAGGIRNNGTLTLDHVTVAGNAVTGGGDFTDGGGGIYNGDGAALNLIDSTVSGNSSGWVGGGIYSFFNSTTNIIRSTISANTSADVAGGLRILGDAQIVNSTISGNTGPAWHGGAIFHTDGDMTVLNSTITGNTPGPGTAAVFVGTFGGPASLTLENSIIAGNAGDQCIAFGGGLAVLTSNGGNIASDATCNLTADGDEPSVDPLLAALADNGGPTQTHALAKKSPALGAANAASCPATDQRGIARPQGDGCDSGAFERVEKGPGNDNGKGKAKDKDKGKP